MPETSIAEPGTTSARGLAVWAENGFATLVAVCLMTLPLANMVATRFYGTGITGAGLFAQNLTLWLGMLGAAIAARDGKLLALATASFLPEARVRRSAGIVAAAVGAAIATIFAVGGFLLTQFDREFESEIVAGVPTWIADLVLPVAFGLIALRLVWRAPGGVKGRVMAGAGLAAGILVAWNPALMVGLPAWPLVVLVIGAGVLGAPIFVILGGAAMLLVLIDDRSLATPLIKASWPRARPPPDCCA